MVCVIQAHFGACVKIDGVWSLGIYFWKGERDKKISIVAKKTKRKDLRHSSIVT